jgi:pimeloyl-ACP methyl ester carboxylesterase
LHSPDGHGFAGDGHLDDFAATSHDWFTWLPSVTPALRSGLVRAPAISSVTRCCRYETRHDLQYCYRRHDGCFEPFPETHDQEPQFLQLGEGARRRRIAFRRGPGGREIGLLWLSGFMSDMTSTKATALAAWAESNNLPMLRFDYSGHGLSEGSLAEASIGDWLEESIAAAGLLEAAKLIVIGSSMGGWLALLLARHLAQSGATPLAGLVLIAPAHDMTQTLIWIACPKRRGRRSSVTASLSTSAYAEPHPITRHPSRKAAPNLPKATVLIRYVRSPARHARSDVPWSHALSLVDLLTEATRNFVDRDRDHACRGLRTSLASRLLFRSWSKTPETITPDNSRETMRRSA